MTSRRGVILLEMLVSMTIFVAGAALTLSVVSNSYAAVERARKRQFARDLAWSKLAELDAGLININDLRDGDILSVGSVTLIDPVSNDEAGETWSVSVDFAPSEFRGLSLVEVTVMAGSDAETPLASAKRLVGLREQRIDEYEEDELVEGLPDERPPESEGDR